MEGIIDTIRKLTRLDRIAFRRHSILRMRQRGIDVDDVKNALLSCKIIEEYPEDRPMPSFLTMGYTRTEEPLHIVIAVDNEDNMLWVITVYRPDPNEWESGFTRRIRR